MLRRSVDDAITRLQLIPVSAALPRRISVESTSVTVGFMVVAPAAPKLSLQCEAIAADTTTIRSLDWDRSRFDIEFGLRNGTTYNAFLVRGNAPP